ncbi:hypothetical protein CLAFUW4_09825 [Fulvia fulva]|uniref:Uncharacterized protein n=1 Tax=Passalora fulva TaxID=5499 RepID=A0A9Q8PHE0_PASFU|nr:uncharacterized protein CLAFUR5_12415 [Fulvia fulva]KAK4615653.1 hypothetical protein CLAFUR4_09831 [Fulvia fulva]KAK4616601.1 hypothetical protein CLAFUR0_09824 [Fulvia fulva]UJO22545.1 hypothetical protein CLAFUR5_12415 [Fulvia fulva]WPV19302.1 hypothetical protein CLAFUW4_09825 [Fulvia fulva]WPV34379.1 hypothetical protein CLAFUW7_09828 [Fulvia fulva]
MAQVTSVLKRLHDANLEPSRDILAIYTDSSCDLRVYVHSGHPASGFRTKTLKNVLKFLLMFEAQFDTIMPDVDRLRRGVLDVLSSEMDLHQVWDCADLLAVCST